MPAALRRRPIAAAGRHSGRKGNSMCDYSLHHLASRPAKIGDRLVTAEFAHTWTRGFASVDEPSVAVCLRPGTELAFDCEPDYLLPFTRWLPRVRPRKLASKLARFRRVDRERADTHHDALEFHDGTVVLLTRLLPGQRATVLQLPPDLERIAGSDGQVRRRAPADSTPAV
jgi:hypothetical protein